MPTSFETGPVCTFLLVALYAHVAPSDHVPGQLAAHVWRQRLTLLKCRSSARQITRCAAWGTMLILLRRPMQRSQHRHAVVTSLRNDHYLPLLLVGLS